MTASNESLTIKNSQNGLNFLFSSFVASTVANVTGIVTGHPLDTVKIRMQLEKRKITMRQCAYEALVNEGPYSLYKGLAQPLIGAVPINIITFTVNDYVKLFLSKHTEI